MEDRIRHSGNFFAGWFILLFLIGLGVVMDPFGVIHDPISDGSPRFWWLMIAGLAAGSFGSYTFFSKPYIEIKEGTLIVQNPLRKWFLPLSEVHVVPDAFPYSKVLVRGQTVWLIATERSNISLVLGKNVLKDRVLAAAESGHSTNEDELGTSRLYKRNGLDRPQLALFVFWVLYLITSVAASNGWTFN